MAEYPSDATLLKRFVTTREEAAFAAVVRRHAPLVREACLRILGSEHDAEEVAQATFLILALKASQITWADCVGSWLRNVARRLSLHARSEGLRRLRRERAVSTLVNSSGRLNGAEIPEELHPAADPRIEIARRELRHVIEQELNRLPEKYREPVVLCDMEGMTHQEAARQLGLPAGSMSRRLGRARSLLRQRLATRGLPLAVGVVLALVLGLGLREGQRGPSRSSVLAVPRLTAVEIHPDRHEAEALRDWLSTVASAETVDTRRADVDAAVRQASGLAASLDETHGLLGGSVWASASSTLRDAATSFAQAAQRDDPPALLAAARRLNASCTQCHLVFAGYVTPPRITTPTR
ncbi:MAG: sigma-70 family RNA polymerase sigma factor [Isosphaeraceae bacterium]